MLSWVYGDDSSGFVGCFPETYQRRLNIFPDTSPELTIGWAFREKFLWTTTQRVWILSSISHQGAVLTPTEAGPLPRLPQRMG